jgi:broad specificity phosphatase PhoE
MSTIPMATSFLLLRHGESEWNAEGRWQGQGDPSLTETGRRQVQRAAQTLALSQEPPLIQKIISSDLKRAAQSAQIMGEALGLQPQYDSRLRELDVGEWEGLSHDEISKRWPADYAAFRAGDTEVRLGGAESWALLTARFRKVLGELARAHLGQKLMLVAHGGAIRSAVPGLYLDNAQCHCLVLPEDVAAAWARGEVERELEVDLASGAGSAQGSERGQAL